MRSSTFGLFKDIVRLFSQEDTLEMWLKVCLIRYFELNVKKAFDAKLIKAPIYLCVGQETLAASLSVVYREPIIFGQHRCHDLYIAYGGDLAALRDELLHRKTGCAQGMGGSASIHSPVIDMVGHDGLMGTQVPIGVGYVLGTMRRQNAKKGLVVMGDASAEEDYVLAAENFASHKKAPILFACFDNGFSVLTTVAVRRSWKTVDVAKAFGMNAVEITDDPWLIMYRTKELIRELPAFINIHTVRHLWHNGTGCDGPPEWDRFVLVKEELKRLGLESEAAKTEEKAREFCNKLWEADLAKGGVK